MDLSTPMRFVMARAQAEAAALSQSEVYPEHILLGILKISEMTAEEISPSSRHKAETDEDIDILRNRFSVLGWDTSDIRSKLRRILKSEPPTGDSVTLVGSLFEKAAEHSKKESLYPSEVLYAISINQSPVIKELFMKNGGKNEQAGSPAHAGDAGSDKSGASAKAGPEFLSELTDRIRTMRYTLLEKVHGQDHVVHAFAEGMFAAEVLAAADESRRRPRAIFVFAGPPGVGKTFLAEQAAKALGSPLKSLDMSGYADHQAHIALIGFAPSYKDAKPGLLTGFVK